MISSNPLLSLYHKPNRSLELSITIDTPALPVRNELGILGTEP